MRVVKYKIYEGRNIYSHRKCVRIDVDLEGFAEIPSKEIINFNENLLKMLPELYEHRCGIDEVGGFVKRLNEGTYLSHICEHIIIAIHNKIGLDIKYGKAREIEGERYYIIFEYIAKKTAIEALKLAVDIINSLIKVIPINFHERIKVLEKIYSQEVIGPTTECICKEATKYNIPYFQLGESDFYQIGYGSQGRIIEGSIVESTSCASVDISCDKLLTKELLSIQNIPVAKGVKVHNVIDLLQQGEKIGYPVVLKPQFGSKGKEVHVNLKDEKELVSAYEKVKNIYKDIIIEKYHVGNDYRVCMVNYEVVAVAKRIPPYITGNGRNTILELIEKLNKNPNRGIDHEKPMTRVQIDQNLYEYIKKKGLDKDYILEEGEVLYIKENANISTGASSEDCTELISEYNREICSRVAKTLGLDICGIDICTEDIGKDLINSGIVIEVNASPGLRMHYYPSKGIPRNVASNIIKNMYNNNPTNIPLISVTGTNGKTTTTRLISHIYSQMGYTVGMTSTEGVFVQGKCIHKGDDTGFYSAKTILMNKDVEVAVLETARGGLIKRGLAYDLADVAVITNITEDHLGIDEVNTMEELVFVKSLVAEAVKPKGSVVINADDYWSKGIIPRIKSEIVYFSKNYENKYIQEAILKGKKAVYIRDNTLYIHNRGREYKIDVLKNIPLTLNGNLEFNIENVLATSAALVAEDMDYAMIKNGLRSYGLNTEENIGRFNMYNVNGVTVILDYGHNIEGYRAVYNSIEKMNSRRKIGVIGIPGDRMDEMAKEIGLLSTNYLDYIIIKEDIDRRGRKEGEMSKAIIEGIPSNCNKYEVVLNEQEALNKALGIAKEGDIVIVFYERLEGLLQIINDRNNRNDSSIDNIIS